MTQIKQLKEKMEGREKEDMSRETTSGKERKNSHQSQLIEGVENEGKENLGRDSEY